MPRKEHVSGPGPAANHTSTLYSKARYAHPFFLPAPPEDRQPFHGLTRMSDWIKQQLGPIPPITHGGTFNLADVIGAAGVREIEDLGEIRFHALGDSGVDTAQEAQQIADEMATDFIAGAGGLNPAFLFHLGDVIYGNDKANHYGERFYIPYRHYPGKIVAIPGNHDGEVKSPVDNPSLSAFVANFCAATASVPTQASGSGVYRETMTEPGVYWFFDAPFIQIIGLYSNCLENPGYLEGITNGKSDTSQLDWLGQTLSAIAKAKQKKALVFATHHPPYSQSGHSGSTEMSQSIDAICTKTGVYPDLFFSGHSHNYQRYTRRMGGKQVPYIIAGTGGMPPQPVIPATGQPVDPTVTYDAALSSLGYLFVTASAKRITVEFWPLANPPTTPFDPLTIDLATHLVS
jgi:calcineurin-like phosphoesterase family protein